MTKTTGSTDLRENFFHKINLPQLTNEQVDILEAPINTDDVIIPKLLKLYNHLLETFTLAPSMREATIILLPKPGKDLGYPESYRPISLLQVDIKILAKILSL